MESFKYVGPGALYDLIMHIHPGYVKCSAFFLCCSADGWIMCKDEHECELWTGVWTAAFYQSQLKRTLTGNVCKCLLPKTYYIYKITSTHSSMRVILNFGK